MRAAAPGLCCRTTTPLCFGFDARSGAIRVNPWSIEAVRDAIYAAIRLPHAEQVRKVLLWMHQRGLCSVRGRRLVGMAPQM